MITKEIKDCLRKSVKKKKIVCLTGAGVSCESGIPPFRGKGGFWEKYNPEIYAHRKGLMYKFREEPQGLVDFVSDFYTVLLQAKPNPAHFALSLLERSGLLNSIITQNIDNLHQEAGSRAVIELHGNALRIRCMHCAMKVTFEKERLREMVRLLQSNRNSRIRLLKVLSRYFPRCRACGSRYRIDIVLFQEMLPESEVAKAHQQLDNCGLLLVVGTSLMVYPAASLPLYAKEKGARVIEINDEPSVLSDICDYKIIGKAGEILPQILEILKV